jgi:hypothetical protein
MFLYLQAMERHTHWSGPSDQSWLLEEEDDILLQIT